MVSARDLRMLSRFAQGIATQAVDHANENPDDEQAQRTANYAAEVAQRGRGIVARLDDGQ